MKDSHRELRDRIAGESFVQMYFDSEDTAEENFEDAFRIADAFISKLLRREAQEVLEPAQPPPAPTVEELPSEKEMCFEAESRYGGGENGRHVAFEAGTIWLRSLAAPIIAKLRDELSAYVASDRIKTENLEVKEQEIAKLMKILADRLGKHEHH